jgi:hypothetical protein
VSIFPPAELPSATAEPHQTVALQATDQNFRNKVFNFRWARWVTEVVVVVEVMAVVGAGTAVMIRRCCRSLKAAMRSPAWRATVPHRSSRRIVGA